MEDDRKNIKVNPVTHSEIRQRAFYTDRTIRETTETLIKNGLILETIDNNERDSK